ncbi:MAG: cytochrome P460 family protein, partial [Alphaproteobacteria bacterium]
EPGGWVYFSFGHHAPPYAQTATAFPAESCNACHESAAADDFVFTQFYPVLRAADPK